MCFTMRLLVAAALINTLSNALENGLGRTPAMGWNSWYDFEMHGTNETTVRQIADEFVKLGLPKLGYEYINLDDGWADPSRLPNGSITWNPTVYPNGLPSTVDYVHKRGLKFGIYTDRGTNTCGGLPGAYGHEDQDAASYASWGIDYLKEDSCHAPNNAGSGWGEYAKMRDALNKTGRPIYFSLCGWNWWYAPVGASLANSWRIGGDDTNWHNVLNNIDIAARLNQYSGPGGWNDPCLLLGPKHNGVKQITQQQSKAQFSMWAMISAPLILSQNILLWDQMYIDIYTNQEVIGIDQDVLGRGGMRILGGSLAEGDGKSGVQVNVWAKQLYGPNLCFAFTFINVGSSPQNVTCDAKCMGTIGLDNTMEITVRDLWTHKDLGKQTGDSLSVNNLAAKGGVEMYKVCYAGV